MFRFKLGAAVTAAAMVSASAASAQVHPMPYANQPFPAGGWARSSGTEEQVHIKTRLKQLHDEAVATQKADGGTLTPEHRAELEAKLATLRQDACNAGMRC